MTLTACQIPDYALNYYRDNWLACRNCFCFMAVPQAGSSEFPIWGAPASWAVPRIINSALQLWASSAEPQAESPHIMAALKFLFSAACLII